MKMLRCIPRTYELIAPSFRGAAWRAPARRGEPGTYEHRFGGRAHAVNPVVMDAGLSGSAALRPRPGMTAI